MISVEADRKAMLDKANEIAFAIASSEEAQAFWQAREKMERHQEAQSLFDSLKKKTNGLLVLEDRVGTGSEKYERIRQETQSIEERLAEIPVALQYKSAQSELNAMLQEVTLVLLARLKDKLPVEPGPRSCGSGGSCSTGGCGGSCTAH